MAMPMNKTLSLLIKAIARDAAICGNYKSYSSAALYVHWPYCKRRCTYCNFNKYIQKSVNHERMKQCLIKEAQTLLQLSGVEKITSVFFGGGTPSLAQPETIKIFLESISKHISPHSQTEISMEVNPTSIEMDSLREFKAAGVNRVSIGVQTLNTEALHILGRDHSVQESLKCLEMAKSLFPSHVSLDLIYGWPGQSLDMWLAELKEILQICDHHISLYQLTIERGTQLFKSIQENKLKLPDSDVTEDMYLQAVELLDQNGFERYEVSNFAKEHCYSYHNLAYWTGVDYIGVGPGAHGRFIPRDKGQREARIQTLEPDNWMWEVENYSHATRKCIPLTMQDQLEELLSVGLRTKSGVTHFASSKICPKRSIEDLLLHNQKVQFYIHKGLLVLDNRGLKPSSEGMNIIDSILPDLLIALQDANNTAIYNEK
uniref:Radical S-adenosyl methionine domain-containing protein 1, mitochondrial n=2 Tax=Biomphalaria glabrata TaxID=6526 RepID=A0A2C9KEF6_BIOGL